MTYLYMMYHEWCGYIFMWIILMMHLYKTYHKACFIKSELPVIKSLDAKDFILGSLVLYIMVFTN